jgi:hypothetical protein
VAYTPAWLNSETSPSLTAHCTIHCSSMWQCLSLSCASSAPHVWPGRGNICLGALHLGSWWEAPYGHNSVEGYLIDIVTSDQWQGDQFHIWNILQIWTFWQAHWQLWTAFTFASRDNRREVTSSLSLPCVEFQHKDLTLWRHSAVLSPPTTPTNAQGLLAHCILWHHPTRALGGRENMCNRGDWVKEKTLHCGSIK